jgi:DNA-binding Lrp family transcriptional regulator
VSSKHEIDQTDLRILDLIKHDARLSFREIGKQLNLSTGTVSERIKNMQASGVIKGFVTATDPNLLGYNITMLMCIRVSPGYPWEDVEKELNTVKEVCCLHAVTGEIDITVLTRTRDQDHATQVIDQIRTLKGVERVDSHMVLKSMTLCGDCGCDCGWKPIDEADE